MLKTKILSMIMILVILTSCKNKSDSMSNEEKIAGKDEKTWTATRETNAQGDKDKLTRDEKKQKITFRRNGNVTMADDQRTMNGQWSYSGSTLTLQFTGENVTENFTVTELDNDKMKLQAADGSALTMEPD